MNTARTVNIVILTLAVVATLTHAVEAPQLINYQGILRDSSDATLSGSFPMVFRFYDGDGGPTCSDGSETLLLTDRHEGADSITASSGVFNVALGGGTLVAGSVDSMNDLFRGRGEVWMEVEVDGESLCPRTRVLASAYAIGAARESASNIDTDGDQVPDTTLYVNGATGDDANDGLTAQTAKATISAAIRALPAVLNSNANVVIAAGTYEESVYISSRVRHGLFVVSVSGPDVAPPSVIIKRPPAATEGFEIGVLVSDDIVELKNLQVEGFPIDGIAAFHGGELIVTDCVSRDNGRGIFVGFGSETAIENVELIDNTIGLRASNGSVEIDGVVFSGNDTSVVSEKQGSIHFAGGVCTLDTAMDADEFTKIDNYGSCLAPGGRNPCLSLPVTSCCVADAISVCAP